MVSLSVRGLSVELGRRRVVDGVDLALTGGELVGVVGPNGAGKSTLARALVGLLPAAAGEVLLDGVPIASLPRGHVAQRVAYLTQAPLVHWPVSIERLVALGRLPHLAPLSRVGPDDAVAIERAMERADVRHLTDRPATELSGGERARVLLARALAVEAPALVADEPLAALDPGHQLDVMSLLRAEAAAGALVMVALHDLTVATRFCDRLVLMDAGRIVADGPPLDVLTPERLASVYGIAARVETSGPWPLLVPTRRVGGSGSGR